MRFVLAPRPGLPQFRQQKGEKVISPEEREETRRRETEAALLDARRKLKEVRDALNAHTVSVAVELEYVERAVSVGMLELDLRIRDESREDAREYAERVRRDAVRNLARVRERVAREAAR